MPNITVYLPDDLHAYVRDNVGRQLNISSLLQEAIRAHLTAHSELEGKFREELEKYRTDPERRAEWERREAGTIDPHAFVPCETCGTGYDEAEGCMAMFEPYDAAPVALIAHFPAELRQGMLQYWKDSGYTDVPMGPV